MTNFLHTSQVDKFLFQLSATRFHSLGLGDENVAGSKYGNMESDFDHWSKSLLQRVNKWNASSGEKSEQCGQQQKTSDFDSEEDESSTEDTDEEEEEEEDGLVDLEDLGKVMKKAKSSASEKNKGPKVHRKFQNY